MWLHVPLTRSLVVGGLLSCSTLLESPAARACKIGCYTGAADEEWTSRSDDWPGSLPKLDADGPLLLVVSVQHGPLELRVNGERRDFNQRSISGDEVCDQQLVSLSPAERWNLGDIVEVGSRSDSASPNDPGTNEQDAWTVYKEVGPSREREDVFVRIAVEWIPQWEFSLSDTLCGSERLSPFTSYGYATIIVDSDSGDFDFSAQATMTLPDETEYRSIAYNRYYFSYRDGKLEGTPESDLVLHVPLTRSDSAPECFHLSLFDDRLAPFYDEEVCPPEHAGLPFSERVAANLRRLAPPPSLAEADAGGCAWIEPPRTNWKWGYLFPVVIGCLLQLRRRRRAQ